MRSLHDRARQGCVGTWVRVAVAVPGAGGGADSGHGGGVRGAGAHAKGQGRARHVCHVNPALILGAHPAAVGTPNAGSCLDRFKERSEGVGVVVGAFVLEDRGHALEAQARVDVHTRQGLEA